MADTIEGPAWISEEDDAESREEALGLAALADAMRRRRHMRRLRASWRRRAEAATKMCLTYYVVRNHGKGTKGMVLAAVREALGESPWPTMVRTQPVAIWHASTRPIEMDWLYVAGMFRYYMRHFDRSDPIFAKAFSDGVQQAFDRLYSPDDAGRLRSDENRSSRKAILAFPRQGPETDTENVLSPID